MLKQIDQAVPGDLSQERDVGAGLGLQTGGIAPFTIHHEGQAELRKRAYRQVEPFVGNQTPTRQVVVTGRVCAGHESIGIDRRVDDDAAAPVVLLDPPLHGARNSDEVIDAIGGLAIPQAQVADHRAQQAAQRTADPFFALGVTVEAPDEACWRQAVADVARLWSGEDAMAKTTLIAQHQFVGVEVELFESEGIERKVPLVMAQYARQVLHERRADIPAGKGGTLRRERWPVHAGVDGGAWIDLGQ